ISRSEKRVCLALPRSCSDWWQPWDDGDVYVLEDGRRSFEFGTVIIWNALTNAFVGHVIKLVARPDWSPNRDDHYVLDMDPTLHSDGTLALTFPWGRVQLRLP
ncbi:unnamed protein product, partial [Discosporangium mesarthrocarpum]